MDRLVSEIEQRESEGRTAKPGLFRHLTISALAKWPLVVGAVLILGSLTLLFHYEPKGLWQKVVLVGLSEIGFAFLIAFIISATIERKSRSEFQEFISQRQDQFRNEVQERERRLGKNIFDYIYSIKLDEKVFRFVEDHIFQSPFYRKNLYIEYDFIEQKQGFVLIRSMFEFDIHNISDEDRDYDIPFFFEKPLNADLPDFDGRSGLFKLFVNEEIEKSKFDEINEAEPDTDEHSTFKFSKRIEAGGFIRVRIGYHIIKRVCDWEIWESVVTCDGVRIKIRFNPEEFTVKLAAMHPRARQFDRHDIDDHQITAELDRPMFPRNGFYLFWAPPKSSGVAQVTDQLGAVGDDKK